MDSPTLEYPRTGLKPHEYRKIVKPLLERRRRARINHCLTELKALLIDNNQNIDSNEASKLEKADILEMTVRHLRDLRRQHRLLAAPYPDAVADNFRAGFTECANEVSACLSNLPVMDGSVKNRLMSHLSECLSHGGSRPLQPAPQHPASPVSPMCDSSAAAAVMSTPTPPPSPMIGQCLPPSPATSSEYFPLSPGPSPLDLTAREFSFSQHVQEHVYLPETSPEMAYAQHVPTHVHLECRKPTPVSPMAPWRPW